MTSSWATLGALSSPETGPSIRARVRQVNLEPKFVMSVPDNHREHMPYDIFMNEAWGPCLALKWAHVFVTSVPDEFLRRTPTHFF